MHEVLRSKIAAIGETIVRSKQKFLLNKRVWGFTDPNVPSNFETL